MITTKRLLFTLAAVVTFSSVSAFAQEEVKLEITSNDMMQYDKKVLEVTTGQKVTIEFKHIGKLPKAAMGHNIVILMPGTVGPAFAMKGMTAATTGYIPQDEESKKLVVAHSEMVGGGETSIFSFVAGAPGEYPYLCTFPGHFALMQGVLTVKPK